MYGRARDTATEPGPREPPFARAGRGRNGQRRQRFRYFRPSISLCRAGDVVFENAGEGTDAVFASVNHTLSANMETLVQQGAGNISGTGNTLANSLFGNSGNNTLDGGAVPTGSPATPAATRSSSSPARATATPSSTSTATARRRAIPAVLRLRPRRHLHQYRCHPLAGELRRRPRLARHHHICQCSLDRRQRFSFCLRTADARSGVLPPRSHHISATVLQPAVALFGFLCHLYVWRCTHGDEPLD